MQIKNLAILQARMSSVRLPGKVLLEINNKPMIYWQISRIQKAKFIDKLVVATSEDSSDDVLANYVESIGVECVRGSLKNVLDRFNKVENIYSPRTILRLTADCPLVMPELIDEIVCRFYEGDYDYVSNILELSFPDGLDVEVFKSKLLNRILDFKLTAEEKEHVTLGILNRRDLFSTNNYINSKNLSHYRWTVDTESDFRFVCHVFDFFRSRETDFTMEQMEAFVDAYPELNQIRKR